MRARPAHLFALILSGLLPACDEKPQHAPRESSEGPLVDADHEPAALPSRLDVLGLLDTCDVSHRGYTLDLGSRAAETQRSYSQAFDKDVVPLRHGGGSFAELLSRTTNYEFWLSEPLEELYVSIRIRGRRSGHVAIYVDEKRLGGGKLEPGEARVVSVKGRDELRAGRHQLSIRLSRGDAGSEGAYAEVEWVRLAAEDTEDEQYAAPTHKDIVTDVVLEKRPRRALALRERSTVRCPLWPAADSRLKLWLGFWGNGSGRAELRVHRQGQAPVVLEHRELTGGDSAGWTSLELPLGRFAGELIGLEFGVRAAKGVGRVAFADPMLTRKPPDPRSPRSAQTVVLVVLAGLRRASLPPWGSNAELPGFGQFARGATAFTNFRVPSSVPAAVLASMLSGMAPRAHAVEDQAARLPERVHTVNEVLKQSSGHAAMFTGVPTSFPVFGFDRAWDEHAATSPVLDEPAHAPFELAESWLKREVEDGREARRFVLVHARGAHPPWDISKEEAAKLKPEEYNGAIDPRRGGIALGNIRARQRAASRRLDTDDWTRLRALELVALKKQDAAFTRLTKTLERLGLWEQALVIVTGDVAAGEPPEVPYDPAGRLDGSRLYLPLLVKFPGRQFAGKESGASVTAMDLAATALTALGLDLPQDMVGLDLLAQASGDVPLGGRPNWATLGSRFATRLGPWRLSGELGKVPALCELAVDPACVNDVFEAKGFVSSSLWKWTYLWERQARELQRIPREPASIDPDTAAALAVWGDLQ